MSLVLPPSLDAADTGSFFSKVFDALDGKIYNKVACSLTLTFMTAVANAQTTIVADLLAVATPVLGTVLPSLTAPLAGNDALQQGWLQLAGGLNPVVNGLLVQGGGLPPSYLAL